MDLPTTSTMIAALISLVTLTMMNHPTYCMAAPQQPFPPPLPLPFKDHHHHHHPRDLLLVSDSASATNSTENKRDHRSPSVSEGGREWSDWSEWGPCSRTCDGGATYQTRQCLDTVRGCPNGRGIRYQICNMQPCPELVDFRLQQCQSYNTIPYQGKLHSWVPHHVAEAKSPCALTCRAVNSSGPLVVQLAARVHDGTRCKPGSLDMCVDGTCQAVGCDLQLNSNLKIDACGVCGGDGSTCLTNGNGNSDGNGPQPRYQWEFSHQLSPCSASCDGGEQEVAVVCRDTSTGAQVEAAELCDPNERPPPKLVKCNQDPCPPKWIVEPWGACSASCGGGVKERHVHCQQGRNHSKVDDVICSALIGHKARTHEPCNTHDCPGWFEGPWSLCSKTCGDDGFQTRPVVCRDARGHVTNACRDQDRPASSRSCPTLDPCPTTVAPELTTTAPNRPARQKVTPFSLFDDDDEEEAGDGEEDGDGEDDKNEADLKGVLVKPSGSSAPAALLSEKLQVGEISLVPTDPTLALYYACGWFYKSFIAGDWSPCSVTCGDGTREREVHCKIFLEFSKTIAKLPDKECPGPKPAETEPCFMRPCSLSNKYEPWIGSGSSSSSSNDQSSYKLLAATRKPAEDLRAATKLELNAAAPTATKSAVVAAAPSTSLYAWKMSGFSQCSASCLGGVQESIIECIREQDGQRVSPQLCPMERRPDSITRTCNDIPCPPRWNASDFSSCSRSCGGGVQTRDVHCIHEVARGGGNTLPVNSDLCPQPPPRAQQFCNMIDCPVEWKTGEWSQCSSTCEGGFRVRKVTCQQLLALGQLITKTANQCNPTTRPAESKPCNSDRVCTSTTTIETGDDRGNSQTAETSSQQTTVDLFLLSTTTPSNETPVPAIGTTTTVSGSSSTSSSTGSRVVHQLAPKILSTNQTFVQQSVTKKKVTLKIGGRATVYKGTQVKIRCPVKHYDKAKILWMKDHTQLTKSPKHELNKKGMLRIRDVMYSDSGVYSCVAGRSVANITLTVRPIAVAPPSNNIGSATPINPDNRQQLPVDDFEDDLQSLTTGIKGNSLTNPHHHPASESGLSDQEQEWYRQTPHYTYVTRARTTTRVPASTTTASPSLFRTATPVFPTTTTTAASSQSEFDEEDEEDGDDEEDETDADDDGITPPSIWPEVVDSVPTFWPTSNWWGGNIDPMRNHHQRPGQQQPLPPGSSGGGGQYYDTNMNNRYNTHNQQPAPPRQRPTPPPPPSNNYNNRNNNNNNVRPTGTSSNNVRSSSSRPIPYFQLLLTSGLQLEWPLLQEEEEEEQQQKKNRRINDQQKTSSRRAKLRNGLVVTTATTRRKTGRPKSNHKAGDSNKIRKEEQLKFEWLVTPWSKCSQTCGGSGFQVRAAQCIVRLNDNVTRSVDSSLCSAEDAGLLTSDGRPPTTVQKCGLETCPKWKTGAWSPCEKSRCFTWNTALQRRPMDCVMDDGTVLDPILCDDRSKPSSKRECFNEHCRGEWKASEWSHCTATCDSVGFQSRLIHCVWNGTDSPAGLACADLPRLDVTRPCRGPPCPERGECLNQSEYCALVQTLELCYIPRYREHCCLTCSRHQPTITTTINNKNNQKKKKKKKTQTMKTKSSSTTHHHRHHHHRKMTTASAPATLSTTALPLKQ